MTAGTAPRPRTSAFAFATDLLDEGVETVLDNIQERGGLDGITPAFAYHAARDVFPHNPKRKVFLLPHGELYFQPDSARYEHLRLQPRVSPLVRDTDVLADTCRAAAGRGLHVNAWTVFLHADRADAYPDCVTRNAFDDPYPTDLCPANPDVRAYARALVSDIARHEISTVLAESLHYLGVGHGHHHERYFVTLGARTRFLLGLCFCEHCQAIAQDAGVETAAVRKAVVEELEEAFLNGDSAAADDVSLDDLVTIAGGELTAYLDVRADVVTSLAAEIAEIAAANGKRLAFLDPSGAVKGYASGRATGSPAAEISWRFGIDLDRVKDVCPEIQLLGYTRDVERLQVDLDAYRKRLAGASIAVALRPSPPDSATPENLEAKVRLVREVGAARVDFYHYGLARLEALDWIRAAVEA